MRQHFTSKCRVSDNDDLRSADDLVSIVAEVGAEVRKSASHILEVGARQLLDLNVRVEDPDVVAAAVKPLGKLDKWTLSQIVRISLEAESQKTNIALAVSRDHIECTGKLPFVCR